MTHSILCPKTNGEGVAAGYGTDDAMKRRRRRRRWTITTKGGAGIWYDDNRFVIGVGLDLGGSGGLIRTGHDNCDDQTEKVTRAASVYVHIHYNI